MQRHAQRQGGITYLGLVLVLVLIGLFAMVAIKVVPLYLENFNIKSSLKSLKESQGEIKTEADAKSLLLKRFGINDVSHATAENVKVSREGKSMVVTVDYEARVPLLGNIDVVAGFHDDRVELDSALSADADRLMRRLGYRFADAALLETALTHRSAGRNNNERLEFLGDAILSFVIADELFRRFPEANKGELSRLRASFVKGETLAELAQDWDLGEYMKLGPGELKSGGFRRASILAGALEAVIGSVYLDGGYGPCLELVQRLYRERLSQAKQDDGFKDPKTRLQEYLQGRGLSLPEYQVLDVVGSSHDQHFTVECRVPTLDAPVAGSGSSRRRAEQEAAQAALERLGCPGK